MHTYHHLYVSRIARPLSEEDIAAMRASRSDTKLQLGLTGVMMIGANHIMELLEGDPHHIKFALEEILAASFHVDVFPVITGKVRKRMFPDWKVGHVPLGSDDKRDLYGDAKCLKEFLDGMPTIPLEKRTIGMLRYFRKRAMNHLVDATDVELEQLVAG